MLRKLLIANRGEIAVRVARAAADLGITTVAIHPADDARSLHVAVTDAAVPIPGVGARAYLDIEAVVAAGVAAGCDAVHPGYGFLSESADFARACARAGMTFVGPSPDALALFGDKARARRVARECGVAVLAGSDGPVDLAAARAFMASLGPGEIAILKAAAGGGGRGMRVVSDPQALDAALARCRSEAKAAFGSEAVYIERFIARARHVEVQVIGDGTRLMALGERECTLQRRHQKLVEIAPSPFVDAPQRAALAAAALRVMAATPYHGLATVEFLVDLDAAAGDDGFVFIEVNPRVQVEHTVTEAVTGIDLVRAQIAIAGGARLSDVGLDPAAPPHPKGFAVQARINAEAMDATGQALPASGTLSAFELPSGPGVRIDTAGYAGYAVNPSYDPLLAKLIVSADAGFDTTLRRLKRALDEVRITGTATNLGFLRNLVARPEVASGDADTRFVEQHAAQLARPAASRLDAFLDATTRASAAGTSAAPPGTLAITAPMAGLLIVLDVVPGDPVWPGKPVAVIEAMKMEHVVTAERAGIVRAVAATVNMPVAQGTPLLFLEEAEVEAAAADRQDERDLDAIRPDLAEAMARIAFGLDSSRPDAVARRRARGQRTARENVDDLCDPGSFVEYGALAIAAQRKRRALDDLIRNTPADGIITGFGRVNGAQFDAEHARTAVLAYDATVLAGTQGFFGHAKTDRLLEAASEWRTPVVLFAEGGGGRPGDTDVPFVAGLDVPTFATFAGLAGAQPLVGIVSGFCFAGNAALLGCCDVIIATRNANIGMGGPAMIEGGGLGVVEPQAIGPSSVQRANGVIDIAVTDEAEATAVAKRYLGYFQGRTHGWDAADQRLLRSAVPENRLRVYEMRRVIELLCDSGSVLELRCDFGLAMITALARIEGRPLGIIANDPKHLSGAIDADAADKAARFLRLCEVHGLPVLSLVDTPGFMVGIEVEAKAQVRHVSRMMVAGASLSVPFLAVVTRKGYGLGAQAMTAGGFHRPLLNLSWPSGEFGGMGLEGAVKLGFKKELEAIADAGERDAAFKAMVAQSYARGKAINMATGLEIDAVIDPADTRRIVADTLAQLPPRRSHRTAKPFLDTW